MLRDVLFVENFIEDPISFYKHRMFIAAKARAKKSNLPYVDVHKNSMGTLLYYPKVLDRPKYCCSECGGTNIQVQAWISPNTGQIIDTLESNDYWCEDCKDRTKLKQI